VTLYRVVVTPEAESGITKALLYIHERSPRNAGKWLRDLYAEIDTLERAPKRCAIARENQYFDETLRQLIFKSHRIIFRIEETTRTVHILFPGHGRQRAVREAPF
jgi:plasmid stabilization system protein ParE